MNWQRQSNSRSVELLKAGYQALGECLKLWKKREKLSVDADFAKANQNLAAVSRTSEAELRTKARKQQNLINLMPHRGIVRTGQNVVRHNFTLSVERGLKHQHTGIRMAFGGYHSRDRKWRQAFQARGLNEVQRQIICNHTHRNAYQNVLHNQDKDHQSGKNSASRWDSKPAENILESQECARPGTANTHPRRD